MSAARLAEVLEHQEHDADRIGDRDLIERWRSVAETQRTHNP